MQEYFIDEYNEEYLKSKGFIHDFDMSTYDISALSRRSTVYKYKSKSLLEIKITIFSDKRVTVNCYLSGTTQPYASWYNRKYGKNNIPKMVDRYISREFRKLKIQKRGHEDEPSRDRRIVQNRRKIQRVRR